MLAYILREWKAAQDELRGFLGDEYQEYNLVASLPNGRPCEDRIILKEFEKLRNEAGLPKVAFHSLRHPYVKYTTKNPLYRVRTPKLPKPADPRLLLLYVASARG